MHSQDHTFVILKLNFEVARSNGLGEDAFSRKYIMDLGLHTKCCPVPLHYVTYAPTKFEVARSNGLEDAFKRII